jgi:ABC-2 type transport system ATP-binding protein
MGIGWRPVAWQGWTITIVAIGLVGATLVAMRHSPARVPVVILIVAVYAMVALRTGGGSTRAPSPVTERERVPAPSPKDTPTVRERPVQRPPRREARASTGPPMVVVEHLTKRFGDRLAVDDVSFTVAAGEVFGFLGPNGAGKTTTVRMLSTLIAPTAGSALVAGLALEPANGVAIRQRIAVMPENPGLYLRLTVAENLELFAGLYGLERDPGRVGRALDGVNLANRADDLCGRLSKGLRQRVALARGLLSDPAVVFLDEPTSGLDPVASQEVHRLVDGLRDRGATVFLTTHRLEEAERLCDRVAILNTSLRTIGPPDELRDRLFTKALVVRTVAPLLDPGRAFSVPGVEQWHIEDGSRYVLTVSDAFRAAPEVTRALVAADADVLSISEVHHSLEDVYLELVDDDVEARQ